MARGRKPKPTALKLLDGNPGKRALPDSEPVIETPNLPMPPEHLSGYALEHWHDVAPALYNCGILTEIDRAALGAYCRAYSVWRDASEALDAMRESDHVTRGQMIKTKNGNFIQNPVVGVLNRAAADMVRYAAEFGMTPSARSRVKVDEKSKDKTAPEDRYLA